MFRTNNQANCIQRPELGNMEVFKASFTNYAFPRHWHENFAIGLIEHGHFTFDYQGQKRHAPACSIVLTNPGEIHTGQALNQEIGWHQCFMHPSLEQLREIMGQVTKKPSVTPYFPEPVIMDPYSERELHNLFALLLDKSSSYLECQSRFLLFIIKILRQHAGFSLPEKQRNEQLKAADHLRQYIREYYTKNVTLDELSAISGLSRFHLLRVFQKKWGVPPHTYQTIVRIQKAKTLLLNGSSIADVALETGFADQSHFTRQFKKFIGVTPRVYQS